MIMIITTATIMTMATDNIMITITVMGTVITTIMISAGFGIAHWTRGDLGVLPLPVWGEGVTALTEKPEPLTPPLSLWEREQTEPACGLCLHGMLR